MSRRLEEHRPAIRQHLRLPPGGLGRQRLDASSLRRERRADASPRRRRTRCDRRAPSSRRTEIQAQRRCQPPRRRLAGIRFSRPSAKKPIHLPSHEKNGLDPPFGAGEWRRIETIERSTIQPLPVLVTGRDDDRPAVRRHRNRTGVAGSARHAHTGRQHRRKPNREGADPPPSRASDFPAKNARMTAASAPVAINNDCSGDRRIRADRLGGASRNR